MMVELEKLRLFFVFACVTQISAQSYKTWAQSKTFEVRHQLAQCFAKGNVIMVLSKIFRMELCLSQFDPWSGYYCCVSKNMTCTRDINGDVECPKGSKMLPWDSFCNEQKQCPISRASLNAVTSNCTKSFAQHQQHCPFANQDSTRICFDVKYIEEFCIDDGEACDSATSATSFKQCHGG